eukprot:scaffold140561_cov485-Phaeocystis_antarctica.AAC.1
MLREYCSVSGSVAQVWPPVMSGTRSEPSAAASFAFFLVARPPPAFSLTCLAPLSESRWYVTSVCFKQPDVRPFPASKKRSCCRGQSLPIVRMSSRRTTVLVEASSGESFSSCSNARAYSSEPSLPLVRRGAAQDHAVVVVREPPVSHDANALHHARVVTRHLDGVNATLRIHNNRSAVAALLAEGWRASAPVHPTTRCMLDLVCCTHNLDRAELAAIRAFAAQQLWAVRLGQKRLALEPWSLDGHVVSQQRRLWPKASF